MIPTNLHRINFSTSDKKLTSRHDWFNYQENACIPFTGYNMDYTLQVLDSSFK